MLEFNGRTLNTPGVLVRQSAFMPDVWWPGGDTCVMLNGDLDAPEQTVSLSYSVVLNGVTLSPLDPNHSTAIEYGQGLVMAPPGWDPPVVAEMPPWYLEGGADLPSLPSLTPYLSAWGPSPDVRKTTSGGSGRLFTSRVPGAIAASVEFTNGTMPRIRDAAVRVAEQWKRACHLYRLGPADEHGVSTVSWWTSKTDPTLLPYQGYSSNNGGPSTLYGAVRPEGVTWPSSGWPVDDPDHFAVDQSCCTAQLLQWDVAAVNAACVMETGIRTAQVEESTGGRGNGHLMRGLACFSMVNEVRAKELMEEQLERNEARNVSGPGWIWPFTDRGNSTDAYHMPPSSVQWISDLLGFSAAQNRNLARSASSFMVGINLLGYDLCLRVPIFWGSDKRERLFAQMELDASHLVGPARAPALNVDSRQFASPSDGVYWDDSAPPLYGLKTNRGDGGSKSVGPRFITPALAAYLSWKPEADDVRGLIAMIRANYGEWNKAARWLEVWSMESL